LNISVSDILSLLFIISSKILWCYYFMAYPFPDGSTSRVDILYPVQITKSTLYRLLRLILNYSAPGSYWRQHYILPSNLI
jgi:hypothetical protein